MKKELSAKTLLVIAIAFQGVSFFIGGLIGASIVSIGLICLLLGAIKFNKEMKLSRRKIK